MFEQGWTKAGEQKKFFVFLVIIQIELNVL